MLAVFRLYLLMGTDLGLGLGPRFLGSFFFLSVSFLFRVEHSLSKYRLLFFVFLFWGGLDNEEIGSSEQDVAILFGLRTNTNEVRCDLVH